MANFESLKQLIANTLYRVKAYNLPSVCLSLGMSEGEESEARSSKRQYVLSRIENWDDNQALELAGKVQARFPDDFLQKQIEELTPSHPLAISEITRQAIFSRLDEFGTIEGKLDILTFMERLWPLQSMRPSLWDYDCMNARDEIIKHKIQNDDDTFVQMLERIEVLDMSNTKLVELLELAAHPLVRVDDDQSSFVSAFDAILRKDGLEFVPAEQVSGYPVFKIVPISQGVKGSFKNLIFAAIGLKPEIVLKDALNNDLEIVKHKDNCLIYDLPISGLDGLSWKQLKEWYFGKHNWDDNEDSERDFYRRLRQSIPENSPGEYLIFQTYFGTFRSEYGESLPALIPQVYLHYDPYTARQLNQKRLERQRMDFLLLLPSSARVVIEVDGKHHYADGEKPSPKKYSEMISADRDLRLAGYEVYRFGGFEFMDDETGKELIIEFFQSLFQKHRVPKRPLPDSE
ncbi:AbiJ-related protein [Bremerella sp. T1]|uniref:AbiJ-related protein n=1 Tax=Bremerella sp. TYQ1 TaxID=3119568 RepID=UPI001CCD9395|nr:hypothetical protein [Bremerella volcania]UBM38387.1 hypothetical protein LA756_10910 [Bremerella volcania]